MPTNYVIREVPVGVFHVCLRGKEAVAGPFDTLDDAKAAYELLEGSK